MPTTPTYLIPYPATTDTPDVPRDMQAQALAVENTLKGKQAALYDSGWLANDAHVTDNVITGSPAGTWATTGVSYRRVGSIVDLALTATWSGGSFSSGSTGNIANMAVGTFQPLGAAITSLWRPHHDTALAVSSSGAVATFVIHTTGIIQLTALVPNITITSGYPFNIQGSWVTET